MKTLFAPTVLFALTFATAVSADVTITKPAAGTRLEPGEQVTVEFRVDSNSKGDLYNESILLELRLNPDAEFAYPETYAGAEVLTPLQSGTGSRPGSLIWTVPADVSCSYCELKITQVPGRGDYDSDGTTKIAIGEDFKVVVSGDAGSGAMGGQPSIPKENEVPSGQVGKPAEEDLGSGSDYDPRGSGNGESAGSGCSVSAAPGSTAAVWLFALGAAFARGRRRGARK
jgi:MYXO-CTERM domain-containing protein